MHMYVHICFLDKHGRQNMASLRWNYMEAWDFSHIRDDAHITRFHAKPWRSQFPFLVLSTTHFSEKEIGFDGFVPFLLLTFLCACFVKACQS